MESVNKLKEAIETFKQKQKELAEQIQKELFPLCQEILIKNPKLESFSWVQYTPYWCDGDVCEFGVNLDWGTITVWDGKKYEDGYSGDRLKPTAEIEQVTQQLVDVIAKIPEDFMQEIFGDHVRVTVTREGFTTDNYDHD